MEAYVEASKAMLRRSRRPRRSLEALSIDEAFLDVRGMERVAGPPGRDRGAAPAKSPRTGRASVTVGVASTAVSRQGGQRRGEAYGHSSSRPGASWLSCTPSEASGSGRRAPPLRHRGCGSADSRPSNRSPSSASGSSSRPWAEALGRHLHALAHNFDLLPVHAPPAVPLDGHAARALGAPVAEVAPGARHRARRARGSPRPGRPAQGPMRCGTVMLRLRFDHFTRATLFAHAGRGHRGDQGRPGRGAGAAAGGPADPSRRGRRASAISSSCLSKTHDDAVQLALPLERRKLQRPRRHCRRRPAYKCFGVGRDHAGGPAAGCDERPANAPAARLDAHDAPQRTNLQASRAPPG